MEKIADGIVILLVCFLLRRNVPMKDSAEIHEDMDFQRGEWKAVRIAWFVLGVLLLAGLAGVFGSGPLSRSTKSDPRGLLSVDYDRFVRLQSPARLKLQLKPLPQERDEVKFWIALDCLDAIEISELTPAPRSIEADGKRVVYSYPSSSKEGGVLVTLYFHPLRIGRLPCRVGYSDGAELEFNQFVYP